MTTDGSTEDGSRQGDAAHQGPGRWAGRGAAAIGMPPGESADEIGDPDTLPTADGREPDISPSLAGGHAGASRREQD